MRCTIPDVIVGSSFSNQAVVFKSRAIVNCMVTLSPSSLMLTGLVQEFAVTVCVDCWDYSAPGDILSRGERMVTFDRYFME